MQALVFTGPGTMELLDMPEPDVADGDVLVHVRSAGICGSELHGARHPGFRVPPLIMGHEFAGISDDGHPVIINPILSCGDCDLCARGLRELCRRRAIIGVHRAGGFAERVAVPRSALLPLPDRMTWDAAAVVEPAANAVHAWRLAGGARDKRVAVLGCGAIGLLCLLVALADGAASVDVTDLAPGRLDAARQPRRGRGPHRARGRVRRDHRGGRLGGYPGPVRDTPAAGRDGGMARPAGQPTPGSKPRTWYAARSRCSARSPTATRSSAGPPAWSRAGT